MNKNSPLNPCYICSIGADGVHFEHIVFQHRFGKHLFEMTILFFEIGYFSAIGLTFGIACQALLRGSRNSFDQL